jgi:hypothetical protein
MDGHLKTPVPPDSQPPECGDPPHTGNTLDVNEQPDRTHGLSRDCLLAKPRERSKSFDTRRNVLDRVRMQGARSAIVSGVKSCKHIADLGPTALAEDETVGPHPQRLTNQTTKVYTARALQIRLASLEANHMRMRDTKLCDILNDDNAFGGRSMSQKRCEKRRFSRPSCACDQHIRSHGNSVDKYAALLR